MWTHATLKAYWYAISSSSSCAWNWTGRASLRFDGEGGVSAFPLVGFSSSQEDDGFLRTRDIDEDDATDEFGVASGVGGPWLAGMAGTGGAEAEGKNR